MISKTPKASLISSFTSFAVDLLRKMNVFPLLTYWPKFSHKLLEFPNTFNNHVYLHCKKEDYHMQKANGLV